MTGRSVTPNHLFKPPRLTADVAQAVDEYRRALLERARTWRVVSAEEKVRDRATSRHVRAYEAAEQAVKQSRMALDEVLLGEEG